MFNKLDPSKAWLQIRKKKL